MSLINIRTKHQPDIWNFLEITDPAAHFSRKFSRFKPVAGEINPRDLFADRLLVLLDIIRRHIMLSWVVLVSSNTAPIQAVIEFATRWDRNMNVLRV